MQSSYARRLNLQSGTTLGGVTTLDLHESEFPEAITGIPDTLAKFTDFGTTKYVGPSYTGSLAGIAKAESGHGEEPGGDSASKRTFDLATSGAWLGESLFDKMLKQLGVFVTSERFLREMADAVSAASARKGINLNDDAVLDALDTVIAQEGISVQNLGINESNVEQAASIVQNTVIQNNRGLFVSVDIENCNTPEAILARCSTGMDSDLALILGQRAIETQLSGRLPNITPSFAPSYTPN